MPAWACAAGAIGTWDAWVGWRVVATLRARYIIARAGQRASLRTTGIEEGGDGGCLAVSVSLVCLLRHRHWVISGLVWEGQTGLTSSQPLYREQVHSIGVLIGLEPEVFSIGRTCLLHLHLPCHLYTSWPPPPLGAELAGAPADDKCIPPPPTHCLSVNLFCIAAHAAQGAQVKETSSRGEVESCTIAA